MVDVTPRDGLRLRGDLLAPAPILARRGVWKKLLHALLDHLGREELLDWSKAVVDSQTYRAVSGGAHRPEPHG
jgi:hypothetical protein